MKIRESIEIAASAEEVWRWLIDPALWPRWNDKLRSVSRGRSGPVVESEQFGAVFQLKRRESESQIEVVRCEPLRHLVLRHHHHHRMRMRNMEVSFALEYSAAGVRLTQSSDFSEAGIPWPFRLLMWWILRFGRPISKSPLQRLKEAVEHREGAVSA